MKKTAFSSSLEAGRSALEELHFIGYLILLKGLNWSINVKYWLGSKAKYKMSKEANVQQTKMPGFNSPKWILNLSLFCSNV